MTKVSDKTKAQNKKKAEKLIDSLKDLKAYYRRCNSDRMVAVINEQIKEARERLKRVNTYGWKF